MHLLAEPENELQKHINLQLNQSGNRSLPLAQAINPGVCED